MSVAVVLDFSGEHSLLGLDKQLEDHLGVKGLEVHTGTADFPFAWFFCDPATATRVQKALSPTHALPLTSVTVLERASAPGAVPVEQAPLPWGGSHAQASPGSTLGTADVAPTQAPPPGAAAAATPSPRRFWRWRCNWVNESSHSTCRKCVSPKAAASAEAPLGWTIGDWTCPSCGVLNLTWRFTCFTCGIDKPRGAAVRQPSHTAMPPPPPPPPPPLLHMPLPPPPPLPGFNVPAQLPPAMVTQLPPMGMAHRLGVPEIVVAARLAMRTSKAGALPCFTGQLKKQGTFQAQVHLLPLREAGTAELNTFPWPANGLDNRMKVTVPDLLAGKFGVIAAPRAALVVLVAADLPSVASLADIAGGLQQNSRAVVMKLTDQYELVVMPASEQALQFWQLPAISWVAVTQGVPGTALLGAVVPRYRSLTLQLSTGDAGGVGEGVQSVVCLTRPTSVLNHAVVLPPGLATIRADGGAFPAECALEEAAFVVTPKSPADIAVLTAALTVPASSSPGGPLLRGAMANDVLWMWPDPSGRPHLLALAHVFGLQHGLLATPSPFA